MILDGPIPAPWTDTSITPIQYPYVRKRRRGNNDVASDSESEEEEEDVEQAIEAESRRKRVLLTTLSRLKKDHGKAKRLARLILEASTQKNTTVEEEECGTVSEPEQVVEVNLTPSPPPKEPTRKERRK